MPAKANKYRATKWGTEPTMDLEVPSGQLCLVRRPGPTGLMKAGILDDLDFLGAIVASEHIPRGEGRPPAEESPSSKIQDQMRALMADQGNLLKAMDLMDRVIEYVVIEPKIIRPIQRGEDGKPILVDGKEVALEDEDREPGAVYSDFIDMEDKAFIFQFVAGGTADLATFREEYGKTVGELAAFAGLSNPSV